MKSAMESLLAEVKREWKFEPHAIEWLREVLPLYTDQEIRLAHTIFIAAAQCLDWKVKAGRLVSEMGLTVNGSGGRLKENPAVKIERDAVKDFLRICKTLHVKERRGGGGNTGGGNLPGRRVHRKGGGYFPE